MARRWLPTDDELIEAERVIFVRGIPVPWNPPSPYSFDGSGVPEPMAFPGHVRKGRGASSTRPFLATPDRPEPPEPPGKRGTFLSILKHD